MTKREGKLDKERKKPKQEGRASKKGKRINIKKERKKGENS